MAKDIFIYENGAGDLFAQGIEPAPAAPDIVPICINGHEYGEVNLTHVDETDLVNNLRARGYSVDYPTPVRVALTGSIQDSDIEAAVLLAYHRLGANGLINALQSI